MASARSARLTPHAVPHARRALQRTRHGGRNSEGRHPDDAGRATAFRETFPITRALITLRIDAPYPFEDIMDERIVPEADAFQAGIAQDPEPPAPGGTGAIAAPSPAPTPTASISKRRHSRNPRTSRFASRTSSRRPRRGTAARPALDAGSATPRGRHAPRACSAPTAPRKPCSRR